MCLCKAPPLPFVVFPSVRVSKPRISFSMSKEANDYLGNVTCWSSKGTPPVNFSLTLDDKEVGRSTATDSLAAWFPVAMAPEVDMGVAQCRATNQVQDLVSEPVTLVVGTSARPFLCGCLSLSVDSLSLSDPPPCCSPSRGRCDCGGGVSLRSGFQTGGGPAELSHRQGDVPSCVLAAECFRPL